MRLGLFGRGNQANGNDAAAMAAAATAQATADNARQMVLKRDPRLEAVEQKSTSLEQLAASYETSVAESKTDRAGIHAELDNLKRTPGPAGKDGRDGTNGVDGKPGIKGDKGDTGPAGPAGGVAQLEYRDGVAVPAMLSLLGISASVDVPITWPTPFPNTDYAVTVQTTPLDSTLIGRTAAAVKSKTAAGIVVTVTTTAVLAAGKCVLSAVGQRKA